MKTKPITVELVDDEIRISIGIDTLATAIVGSKFMDSVKITDNAGFAQDIIRELEHEDETGCTMVHELFDKAADHADNNGSQFMEFADLEAPM